MRPEAPRVLTARDLHAVDVSLDGSGAAPAVRLVVAARMSADGGRLVVLGPEPPFVHVLGADGRPLAAFGSRGGDGLQAPVALAVSDAGEVLVADATGPAVVFGLDGTVRDRIADTGVLPMAAAAPCAGEWLVYGPRRGATAGQATEWLHRAVGARQGGKTSPLRLAGRAPALVTWRCGEAAPSESPLAAGGRSPDAGAAARTSNGRLEVRVPPGARAPSGVAMLATGGVLLADVVPGTHAHTDLTLLKGGTERHVQVGGAYVLRDSRPGVGVLLQTMDPAPRLFVVSEKDILSLFP